MMITVDAESSLLISGQGDVVQPTDGIVGIGSGGNFAVAAAKALVKHSELSASEIVREALTIASNIDVFTNSNLIVEEIPCTK
jgi:ATP-dependent HslUV protease subunit HslV